MALIYRDLEGHYPGGAYTCLYDGRGKIEFAGAATIRQKQPGRILVDVDPNEGGIILRIVETDPEDPIRHIRMIMPGFEQTYGTANC